MTTITLKTLNFSNMFSYGAHNCVDLNKHTITQLTAANGSGKSSIALIVQELLYGKNVKGIKKTDIINRWSKSKDWEGSLSFSVNEREYVVSLKRNGATSKLALTQNGIDISEHKVLDTYKKLSDILGLDFTVFSQLTYQSSTDLLEFLKATDTNRKKFLINLFNLERYLEIGDSIKLASSAVDKELADLQGQLKSVEAFLNSTTIPNTLQERVVPEYDATLDTRLAEVVHELDNIASICKRIDKNNMNIRERESIQFSSSITPPELFDSSRLDTQKQNLFVVEKEINRIRKEIAAMHIRDTCPSCGQPIDNSHIKAMKASLEEQLNSYLAKQTILNDCVNTLTAEFKQFKTAEKAYADNQRLIERFEQLTQLVDTSMPREYPNYENLAAEKKQLEKQISAQTQSIRDAIDYNKKVSANNAKAQALIEQKNEFLIRQTDLNSAILEKSSQQSYLAILKKAFSPSGIVAFKLEHLTKTLEETINHYLSILSDGQFQIEFILDKEKLNINVINNGASAPIETMSGGEFSRIQTSILLAIRSLLAKLGGSSVNLLFLDEITGVLDDEGKEKLIEVLQREYNLNVFLISHDFTHPLIPKIQIVKNNNISEIVN